MSLHAVYTRQAELGALFVQGGEERQVEGPLVDVPEDAIDDRRQPLRIANAQLRERRMIGRRKDGWAKRDEDVGNAERLGDRAGRDLEGRCGDDEIASARRLGQHAKL